MPFIYSKSQLKLMILSFSVSINFSYRWLKTTEIDPVPLPLGMARITRPGKHATVVTYSAMVHEAVRAADRLAKEGWEIEVVDLRSVKPLDMDTVIASVARTGRLLALW